MPEGDYIPHKEGELAPLLENFIAMANSNLAALGITSRITTNLTKLKASSENKMNSKTNAIKEVRISEKQIQAKPGAPVHLKSQLGITVPGSQPAPQVPLPPTELTALAEANETNTMKWNRSSNPSNTVFVIECRHTVNLPWQIAGTTTKTIFEHQNQVPGYTLFEQVKAQRNQLLSPPSNEAVVYVEGVASVAVV